jgi:hypothetical protein
MGVWQGVAIDSLKYHQSPPCPIFLCPAGRPSLERTYSCSTGGSPAGRAASWQSSTLLETPRRTLMSWNEESWWSVCLTCIHHCIVVFSHYRDAASSQARAECMGGRHSVSKGVEDGGRLPILWAGTPETAVKSFQGWPTGRALRGWAWWALAIL